MHEALLQHIWKNSLLTHREYLACTGEKIEIIEPGQYNSDGGPDFTNARIKINETTWAGNVEIHVNASDWQLHEHHTNPAYNNVILHAVHENDKPSFTAAGRRLPTISIQIEPNITHNYHELIDSRDTIRCREKLHLIETSEISFWLSALSIERLEAKTSDILELFKSTNNSWEESFYIHLARSFGLKINVLPFELLARSIPLKIISKHNENLLQLEALFFGQAGMLTKETHDEYSDALYKEYNYLKRIYDLKPIPPEIFKFLRLRPTNFPTIRLSQFSSLIHQSSHLFSKSINSGSPAELLKTYECSVSEYWKKHYTFGKVAEKEISGKLGKKTRMLIITNTVVPFMFAYGFHKNKPDIREKAIQLLETMPSETNRKTENWKDAGIPSRHASDSQALLQLTNCYCEPGECLKCRLGNRILTQ